MSEPLRIDIGICTYQRQAVVATIASFARLALPFNVTIHLIVADNDITPSAQVEVARATAEHQLDVTYLHAPAKNISIARNACLDAATGDYLAFIDDDEAVAPDWLSAILDVARESLAEVVLGPVQAIYDSHYPAWLVLGDFHSTKPVWVKGRIITGYGGNVLLKRDAAALQGLRFREDLGIDGGEDTDFFTRATANGAKILYAAQAIAYEPVMPERASMRWLLQRRARFGRTYAMQLREQGKAGTSQYLRSLLKAAYSYAVSLLLFYDAIPRRRWRLRAAFHFNVSRHLRGSGEHAPTAIRID